MRKLERRQKTSDWTARIRVTRAGVPRQVAARSTWHHPLSARVFFKWGPEKKKKGPQIVSNYQYYPHTRYRWQCDTRYLGGHFIIGRRNDAPARRLRTEFSQQPCRYICEVLAISLLSLSVDFVLFEENNNKLIIMIIIIIRGGNQLIWALNFKLVFEAFCHLGRATFGSLGLFNFSFIF